jgi:SRSO17 transposase
MSRAASSPERRFSEFVSQLSAVLGHADRREPLRGYLMGLLLPGDRKSVEPMAARRASAGVPKSVRFQTKWSLAISLLDGVLADDLPRAPVVADAGYGSTTAFRDAVTARGLSYAVGVTEDTSVWPPGQAPPPPLPRLTGRGRPPRRVRRTTEHQPVALHALAHSLPTKAWHSVRWREGTRGTMTSRFAALRVRPAHRDEKRTEPRPVEWLLIEWPMDAKEPTKYWLSTVPADVELEELVRLAKLRWRVERDFQELKDELGLDHYDGRSWLGFHHHGALCIAAYAFLATERARLSPPGSCCLPPSRSASQGLQAAGLPRCGLSGIAPPRSRPCAVSRPKRCSPGSPAVPPVTLHL